jgi:multimeric flavodoxin WrbA
MSHTILGVSGSPRQNGNSEILLEHILEGAHAHGCDIRSIRLRDYHFQACIGCEKCRKDNICTGLNDGMHLIYPSIRDSQGMVLISPTHNYNVTALMKAFIDRLYCFYDFTDSRPRDWKSRLANQGRKAIVAAICEQENKQDMGFTLEAMRTPIEAHGYEIVEEMAVFNLFDRGAIKRETETLEQAYNIGKKLALSL